MRLFADAEIVSAVLLYGSVSGGEGRQRTCGRLAAITRAGSRGSSRTDRKPGAVKEPAAERKPDTER